MPNEKIIGIVGGMGPRAGLALHDKIIENTDAQVDQDHLPVIHFSFSGFVQDRTQFLEGEVDENPAVQILKVIEMLYNAGANVIAIPCNTSHAPRIYDAITLGIRNLGIEIELKHIINESIAHLKQEYGSIKRVGVLATNGTYKSKAYDHLLARNGFEVCVPDWSIQNDLIHRMVYDKQFGIKSNYEISSEVCSILDEVLHYFKSNDVDAVILGCTEFSLLPKHLFGSLTVIDSLDVLASSLITSLKEEYSDELNNNYQVNDVLNE